MFFSFMRDCTVRFAQSVKRIERTEGKNIILNFHLELPGDVN